jgi:hypothetical protein
MLARIILHEIGCAKRQAQGEEAVERRNAQRRGQPAIASIFDVRSWVFDVAGKLLSPNLKPFIPAQLIVFRVCR